MAMAMSVNIRKQGGAAVITLPAYVLKMLNLHVGEPLALTVHKGAMIAKPAEKVQRQRYSLQELLAGTSVDEMRRLNAKTAWARDGKPMGRELL